MRSWNEAPAARARRNGQLCGVCAAVGSAHAGRGGVQAQDGRGGGLASAHAFRCRPSSTSPSSASPCGRPPVIAATRSSACASAAVLRYTSCLSAFKFFDGSWTRTLCGTARVYDGGRRAAVWPSAAVRCSASGSDTFRQKVSDLRHLHVPRVCRRPASAPGRHRLSCHL